MPEVTSDCDDHHPAATPLNSWALIPAYKEAKHISEVVQGVRKVLQSVLVIDDGSGDHTAVRAREAGAEVIKLEQNEGKGNALKRGFRTLIERDAPWVICLDGDGQHAPEDISAFLDCSQQTPQPALIIGNRFSNPKGMPPLRYWTNRLMSGWISRMCGQSMPDTQCGFRLLRADLLPQMDLQSSRYDYESEMIFVVGLLGKPISSVPVRTIYADEKSKIRPLHDTLRFAKLVREYGPKCRRASRARARKAT